MMIYALLGTSIAFNLQTPPANDPPEAVAHIAKARELAGKDLAYLVTLFDQVPGTSARPPRSDASFKPAKIFDELYILGESSVTVFALTTSKGIVLIDAGYAYFPEEILIPQMKQLGLNPNDIKYILLTHGHPDHAFGIPYFQDRGVRVFASAIEWKGMQRPPRSPGPNPRMQGTFPKKDGEITDGQKFTLGDGEITCFLTPGHTEGTVSMLIPVKDNGKPHMAALWGGSGFMRQSNLAQLYPKSLERFSQEAAKAKADIYLSNHPFVDNSIAKISDLKDRKPTDANPFIVGEQDTKRFFDVIRECAEAWRIRLQAK